MFRTSSIQVTLSFLTFILLGNLSLSASINPTISKGDEKYRNPSKIALQLQTDSILKAFTAPTKEAKLPYIAQTKVCFDIGWEVYKMAKEEGWSNTEAFEAGNSIMMALLVLRHLRIPEEE